MTVKYLLNTMNRFTALVRWPLKSMRRVYIFLICMLLSVQVFAQSNPQPRFEVASVRPARPDERGGGYRFEPNGRAVISNFTLKNLIMVAWHLQDFQIAEGPAWIDSDRYDIEARATGNPDEGASRMMLRTLLIERFGLRARREIRDLPEYSLVSAKSTRPSGLQEASDGKCTVSAAEFPPTLPANQPPYCGFKQVVKRAEKGSMLTQLRGTGVTLSMLARILGNILDYPVVDSTGIDGRFDFTLEFADDHGGIGPSPETSDVGGASIFTALQEQLGLKLQSRKGPQEVLVVDHADRPTGN
jgi:uncharacterized protein (TIGR03435 family)